MRIRARYLEEEEDLKPLREIREDLVFFFLKFWPVMDWPYHDLYVSEQARMELNSCRIALEKISQNKYEIEEGMALIVDFETMDVTIWLSSN